ncbi:MAG: transglutaminase-like domain-containing protein [Saprospiraceae bacterium]
MKHLAGLVILFCLASPMMAQSNVDGKTEQLYQLAASDLKKFAETIAGKSKSDFKRTQNIVTWLAKNFAWTYTDYQKRTVQDIIQRRGGNCNELAIVSIACMKELGIQYRRVREINLHKETERRQQDAAKLVLEKGNRMSVFGWRHNDHVWIEVFDPKTNRWFPADPSLGVVGETEWLAARYGFGKRFTLDPSSEDMIAPFAVFALDDKGNVVEDRTQHYAVEGFNQLYKNKLAQLPSWKQWQQGVALLAPQANEAFAGKTNLHDYTEAIHQLWQTYQQLKQEYMALK